MPFRHYNKGDQGRRNSKHWVKELYHGEKERRPMKHTFAFCTYLKVPSCLQQGSTPRPSALDLSSPLCLQQSHPTTSASMLMMTGTSHNEPPTHLCNFGKQLASSFTHPQSLHPSISPPRAGPSHSTTTPPDFQLLPSTLFRRDSCWSTIASLPPRTQASLHPLCNNYGTQEPQDTSTFFTQVLPQHLALSGG